MPRPPKGFDRVNEILNEYDSKMKDAIAEPHEGKRKVEMTWGVAAINRERTRRLFRMWRDGEIAEDVLEYCCKVNFIDSSLVRLWRIPGYESACCADCVQSKGHDFGGACICRVPAEDRMENEIQCKQCGCTGCAPKKKVKAKALDSEVPKTESLVEPKTEDPGSSYLSWTH